MGHRTSTPLAFNAFLVASAAQAKTSGGDTSAGHWIDSCYVCVCVRIIVVA